MGILAIYGLLFVILMSGFFCELLTGKRSERSLAMEWPWAFGIGVVAWGYGMFLWNFAGARVTAFGIRAVLTMALIIIAPFYKRIRIPRIGDARIALRDLSWLEQVALTLLVFSVGASWMQACTFPLYHVDALSHFGVGAKALFHLGTYRAPFFFERGVVHNQPDYPLLAPYLEALVFWVRGFADDLTVRHLFFMFWIAFLGILYRGLRDTLSRRQAWLALSLFGTLPLFTADDKTQAVSGCADIAFAFFWTGMVLSGVHVLQGRGRPWKARMIVFSVGLIFLKPQGVPVSFSAWALLIFALKKARWKEGAACFAAFLTLALPWFWTAHALPREITFPPLVITAQSFTRAWERAGPLVLGLCREWTQWSHWGIFWIAMPAILAIWRFQRPAAYFLAAWSAQFLIYMSVYLLYPQPVSWWIVSSLSRWLMHGSGLLVLAVAWTTGTSRLSRFR